MRKFSFVVAMFVGLIGFSVASGAEESNKTKDSATFAVAADAKPAKNFHITGPDSTSENYKDVELAKDGASGTITVGAVTKAHPEMDSKVNFKVDTMSKSPEGMLNYVLKFDDGKLISASADKSGKIQLVDMQPLGALVAPIPVK